MPIITFTSDFGLEDAYVGVVHGVIARIAPEARLIDLTHGIPPQDVTGGALALYAGCRHFPEGSIHLAVVDPGVGTARRALLLRAPGGWFIGPDNGLFTLAVPRESLQGCWELTNRRYWLPGLSRTFHARDLFAPAAAHLAAGVSPDELGRPAPAPRVLPELELADIGQGQTVGRVLSVDHFGNLITNLRVTKYWDVAVRAGAARCRLGDRAARPADTYGAAAGAPLVVLAGSTGLLEVAAPNGNAALETGMGAGAAVRVTLPEDAFGLGR